jgi:hypothetical protein
MPCNTPCQVQKTAVFCQKSGGGKIFIRETVDLDREK